MSLYGNQIQIGGVTCGMVTRGSSNGRYLAVFEREFASLEDIETIAWDKPEIQGECILPQGYGFTVVGISYSSATRSYTVELQVAQQYLGDVAGYQTQVSELEGQVAQQQADLQAKAQELESKEATIQSQAQTLAQQEETITQQTQELEDKQAAIQEQAGTIQAQAAALEEKDATIQSQQETIEALEASGTAKQVEDKLEAAYQEGVESNG